MFFFKEENRIYLFFLTPNTTHQQNVCFPREFLLTNQSQKHSDNKKRNSKIHHNAKHIVLRASIFNIGKEN